MEGIWQLLEILVIRARLGKVQGSAHAAESGAYIFLGLFCSLSWLPKQEPGEGLGASLTHTENDRGKL